MIDFTEYKEFDDFQEYTSAHNFLRCLMHLKVINFLSTGWNGKNHVMRTKPEN